MNFFNRRPPDPVLEEPAEKPLERKCRCCCAPSEFRVIDTGGHSGHIYGPDRYRIVRDQWVWQQVEHGSAFTEDAAKRIVDALSAAKGREL